MLNLIPNAIKEYHTGTTCDSVYDELYNQRIIYLAGTIDTAEEVAFLIMQIMHLSVHDPDSPITLVINSPGGNVLNGMAVYDALKASPCRIITVCIGTAASMGAVLFEAGDERCILPHSSIMIHDPSVSNVYGTAVSLQETVERVMDIRDMTAGIFAERTGKTKKEILRLTSRDTWMDAETAVRENFADRIVNTLDEVVKL